MTDLTYPNLPEGVVEHIYAVPGEHIRRGQALALVRTERFAYDIPAAASGTLLELRIAPGDRIEAGQTLALLGEREESAEASSEWEVPAGDNAPAAAPSRAATARDGLRATPLARRIAAVHGLDLVRVPAGGIRMLRRADVLRMLELAATDQRSVPPAVDGFVQGDVSATAPSALTAMEVDWSTVDDYIARQRRTAALDRRACLVSAAATALLRHHLAQAGWSEHGVVLRRNVDIQIGEQVVHNAADLSPAGVAKVLAGPAQAGDGRCFVIVEHATAAWSEAALATGASAMLCVGQAETKPRVDDHGRVAARPVAILALVYDVRVLDQRLADAFLAELRARLERMGSLC